MADRFSSRAASLSDPATGGFAITPDNNADLSEITRGVYVGNGGKLVVELMRGGEISFENVPSGALLPLRVARVKTGTTCSALVGLA